MKEYSHIWLLLLLSFTLMLTGDYASKRLWQATMEQNSAVVVLDPGHGGEDPGKVGATGITEKQLNLAIAQKTAELLEKKGVHAVLTRESDTSLGASSGKFKKSEDLRERIRTITEENAVLAVSIHQNSYPGAPCTGAQVFYYSGSDEGCRLAQVLQSALEAELQPQKGRKAKANKDYYLLRKSPCVTVIAECGFLSTPSEEALLCTEEYQERIAKAIADGILDYLGTMPEGRNETNGNESNQGEQSRILGGGAF